MSFVQMCASSRALLLFAFPLLLDSAIRLDAAPVPSDAKFVLVTKSADSMEVVLPDTEVSCVTNYGEIKLKISTLASAVAVEPKQFALADGGKEAKLQTRPAFMVKTTGGSSFVCTFRADSFNVVLQMPDSPSKSIGIQDIASLQCVKKFQSIVSSKESVYILTKSGDFFLGTTPSSQVTLKTALGEISVPIAKIATLAVDSQKGTWTVKMAPPDQTIIAGKPTIDKFELVSADCGALSIETGSIIEIRTATEGVKDWPTSGEVPLGHELKGIAAVAWNQDYFVLQESLKKKWDEMAAKVGDETDAQREARFKKFNDWMTAVYVGKGVMWSGVVDNVNVLTSYGGRKTVEIDFSLKSDNQRDVVYRNLLINTSPSDAEKIP